LHKVSFCNLWGVEQQQTPAAMNTFITLAEANDMIKNGDYITGHFIKLLVIFKAMGMSDADARVEAKALLNQVVDKMND
jgi:hypothetical protein